MEFDTVCMCCVR